MISSSEFVNKLFFFNLNKFSLTSFIFLFSFFFKFSQIGFKERSSLHFPLGRPICEITIIFDSFSARRMVEKTLSDFERYALPKFDSIRWQVIHNDMNPDNVLLDTSRKRRVCGMIDFGDMVYSPLIIDLAVATAYLHTDEGNPMLLMNHFVAGYNQETPLLLEELDILFDLIKTRIATTVAVLEWRKSFRDKDDPYLELNSNDRSKNLLERCMEIPRDHAIQTFKQICAKP